MIHNNKIKIADFGFARTIEEMVTKYIKKNNSFFFNIKKLT